MGEWRHISIYITDFKKINFKISVINPDLLRDIDKFWRMLKRISGYTFVWCHCLSGSGYYFPGDGDEVIKHKDIIFWYVTPFKCYIGMNALDELPAFVFRVFRIVGTYLGPRR